MSVIEPSDLGNIALFRNLTDDELEWLATHLHQRVFGAGSNLALAEQPGEVIYIVLEGTLKIFTDRVVYQSADKTESSRSWRWADVQSVSRSGPRRPPVPGAASRPARSRRGRARPPAAGRDGSV